MKLKFLLSAVSIAAIWDCAASNENWDEFVKKSFSEVKDNCIKDTKGEELKLANNKTSLKESFENAYLLTQMGITAAQKGKQLEVIKNAATLDTVSRKLGWLILATAYNVYSKNESIVSWDAALSAASLSDSNKDLEHDAKIYLEDLGLLEYINSYAKGRTTEDKDFIIWNNSLSSIVESGANSRNDLKDLYKKFEKKLNSIENPIGDTSTTPPQTETTQTTQPIDQTQENKKKNSPPLPPRSQAQKVENTKGQTTTPTISEAEQMAPSIEKTPTPQIEEEIIKENKQKLLDEEKIKYDEQVAPLNKILEIGNALIKQLDNLSKSKIGSPSSKQAEEYQSNITAMFKLGGLFFDNNGDIKKEKSKILVLVDEISKVPLEGWSENQKQEVYPGKMPKFFTVQQKNILKEDDKFEKGDFSFINAIKEFEKTFNQCKEYYQNSSQDQNFSLAFSNVKKDTLRFKKYFSNFLGPIRDKVKSLENVYKLTTTEMQTLVPKSELQKTQENLMKKEKENEELRLIIKELMKPKNQSNEQSTVSYDPQVFSIDMIKDMARIVENRRTDEDNESNDDESDDWDDD